MPLPAKFESVPWKEKILDYEIEIKLRVVVYVAILTWKEKILDYEIEIVVWMPSSLHAVVTWKEKILDYEIEIRS